LSNNRNDPPSLLPNACLPVGRREREGVRGQIVRRKFSNSINLLLLLKLRCEIAFYG
jgi:hypothetical protein